MRRNLKPILIFLLLAGLILPAGCDLMAPRTVNDAPLAPPQKADVEEPYPASPEEVVMFFIDAYTANPADGLRFLSPGLTATLSEESAGHLLPANGVPDGYNLQEGATSLESQTSSILVEFNYETITYWMEFGLTQVSGKWMIDRIVTV